MQIFKWKARCTNDCKNKDGTLELFVETHEDIAPVMTCGPCGGKIITDVVFVESYTISE